MTNIFIIHGTEGYPEENWIPWLRKNLEKLGHQVFVPQFPTPEGQNLKNWLKAFKPYQDKLDQDSILVGHSIGPAFLLTVIENLSQPVKAAFLVSCFLDSLGFPKYDALNKTFIQRDFDWEKIKSNCQQFHIFHADNDPYVPLEKAQVVAKNLGVEIDVIKNAGHLNAEAGYTKFELLLERIKKELSKEI